MSFKSLLKEKIEREKYVSYESLISFAIEEGYRPSNAERRLRELCNEFPIEALEMKSKRGTMYIQSYIWKEAGAWELHSATLDTVKPFATINGKEILLAQGSREITQKELSKALNFPAPFPVKKEQNKGLFK